MWLSGGGGGGEVTNISVTRFIKNYIEGLNLDLPQVDLTIIPGENVSASES